ncbi:MAG: hypothetical protein AAFW97_14465 [Pseudomonadota bacterium]
MSSPFKAVGKVFRKVVKTAKKVALPALAIGAAVVTGGAALGVLGPAGLGSLGISVGLQGVISTVGTGALIGGAGALLTGKNVIKGATLGGVIGGVTGGLSLAMGSPITGLGMGSSQAVAGQTASTASEAVSNASKSLISKGIPTAAAPAKTAATAATEAIGESVAGKGLGSAVSNAQFPKGPPPFSPGAEEILVTAPQEAVAAAAAPSAAGVPTVPVAAQPSGGVGDFVGRNPLLVGGLLQGLGSAVSGPENSAVDVIDARGANYGAPSEFGDSYTPPGARTPSEAFANEGTYRWRLNPQTREIERVRVA